MTILHLLLRRLPIDRPWTLLRPLSWLSRVVSLAVGTDGGVFLFMMVYAIPTKFIAFDLFDRFLLVFSQTVLELELDIGVFRWQRRLYES